MKEKREPVADGATDGEEPIVDGADEGIQMDIPPMPGKLMNHTTRDLNLLSLLRKGRRYIAGVLGPFPLSDEKVKAKFSFDVSSR